MIILTVVFFAAIVVLFIMWMKERLKTQTLALIQTNLQERLIQESQFRQQENQRFALEKETKEKEVENLKAVFQNLASEALGRSNQMFLDLANERFDRKNLEGQQALDDRVGIFQRLVDPLKATLEKVEKDLILTEKSRSEQFGVLSEKLMQVTLASELVRREAGALTSALKRPEVRGSWGEIQLRRVVELAGMSAYCDFEEQPTVEKDLKVQRPDLIIRLPNQRQVVVDSKAVLDAFLLASQTVDSGEKEVHLKNHALSLRKRVQELSRKSYWEQFKHSPDFAILFIPNEGILAAAVEVDRQLIEDALRDRIVIATPTTLVALLKAIAFGWQQDQVSKNAESILALAKELMERFQKWHEHFETVGSRLEAANRSYLDAQRSLDSRLYPSLRKMHEMGVPSRLPEISGLD